MSFYSRIRNGNIPVEKFLSLTVLLVADLPAPQTMQLSTVEQELNVTGTDSDDMQQVQNLLPPAGSMSLDVLRSHLNCARDNVPGYGTDADMKTMLGIA